MRAALMLFAVAPLLAACVGPPPASQSADALRVAPDIVARRAQFAPHDLTADVSALSAGDQEALTHLIAASRAIDEVFVRQAWQKNPEFAEKVAALEGPDALPAQQYYRMMYGPWDRLRDFEPFIGQEKHPEGAGFYPEDMTKDEFNGWLKAHPDDHDAFTGLYTVIRRHGDALAAVPYSQEYHDLLAKAADELRAAAAATDNASLKHFLELRADAFASDDYYASDVAWMDLDSALEIVIGPYETYEDGLFGYKAAFESFVCVVQPEESHRLDRYKGELPFLERNLPIPDEHKNLGRGSESPIRVADELFTAGDARAGVQTLAFNLPNDERVREAKGSKKVLLKNVMQAKYDTILEPIAGRVLPPDQADRLAFDSYFHFILFHEMSHGLGPGRITVNGRATEVRLELKDLYSAMEEAKADVVGVDDLYALAAKGVVPQEVVDHLPWTYLAGLFRAARFGTTEAHGLGVVIQANYLLDKGAITVTSDGRFQPDPAVFPGAIRALAHDLLMVQAEGSYAGAQDLVKHFGTVPPAMQKLLDSLGDIPVDIDPSYPIAEAPKATAKATEAVATPAD